MATVVAINILNDRATLVTAETGAEGIALLDSRVIDVSPAIEDTYIDDDEIISEEESEDSEEFPGTTGEGAADWQQNGNGAGESGDLDLELLLDTEIDSTLAVIPAQRVLYEKISLPFKDQKKIDQVAPLQVQDTVPFDIDNFVVDNLVLGPSDEFGYNVLSSLIPKEEVSHALYCLRQVGADPKIISTRASAIAALVKLYPDKLHGTFGILSLTQSHASLALFVDGTLVHLREFFLETNGEVEEDTHLVDRQSFISGIRSSIARIEKEGSSKFYKLFALGPTSLIAHAERRLNLPFEPLDLGDVVRTSDVDPGANGRGSASHLDPNDFPWALGLFAHEASKESRSKRTIVDFRRGPFAYKPALGNLLGALKEELFYIALAIVLGIGWVGTMMFTTHSELSQIESAITSVVQKAFPGETIPKRRELTFVEQRLEELEAQLSETGSLNSLTPLDQLRELSETLDRGIDVNIDEMNIRNSVIRFRGSVKDTLSYGKLETALNSKKDRFCDVKTRLPGGSSGASRKKFSVEIRLCD